jgi:branched-chain amino acid aminotransferase
MNIFFKIDGKFITPKLDGSVLDGITRKSVMTLLKDFGFDLTERRITIDEIIEAEKNGTLEEAFGTGTAVNIAMIESIGYDGGTIHVSDDNPIGDKVNNTLDGIKTGKVEDKFDWMLKVTK